MGGEVADELAEVDPPVRRVIEDEPRPVEELFDARELHLEAALPDLQLTDPAGVLLALLMLQPEEDVVAGCLANDGRAGISSRLAPRVELGDPARHLAECRPLGGSHHDRVPGRERAETAVQCRGEQFRRIQREVGEQK
jgi:hypothetical protein